MKFAEKLQVAVLAAFILALFDWSQTEKVWANNVTYPTKNYTFSPSTTISSSQVNSNFDQLFNELAGNVGTANLLADAVTTAKIADSNVTTAKLASQAVTLAKIYQTGNTDQFLRADGTYSAPASRVPTGCISVYAGSSAPTNWLLCYGQAVNRTTYAGLFAVVSTTYGAGDGSTTFNLPDLRGRVAAGVDNMGGSTASRITNAGAGIVGTTLGAAGGTETHTLTTNEIPAHTHTYTQTQKVAPDAYGTGAPLANLSQVAGVASGSTGGGAAHQNTQPTMMLNYIIKY